AGSADEKTIAYLSFLKREEYPVDRIPGFGAATTLSTLSTISVQGGTPQRLSTPRAFGSVFFMADGKVAWTVAELGRSPQAGGRLQQGSPVTATVVEVRAADGAVSRLGSLPGAVGRAVLNARSDGFYYLAGGNLRQFTFGDAEPNVVGSFAGGGRIDVTSDNQTIYVA